MRARSCAGSETALRRRCQQRSGYARVWRSVAGGFAPAVHYAVGDAPDIALGDCDGNHSLDLLYVNGEGAYATLAARRNLGSELGAP